MEPSTDLSKRVEPTAQEVIDWLRSEDGQKELRETIKRADECVERDQQARTYPPELLNMRMTI